MSEPAHIPHLNCWIVTDGRRGIQNQAEGLAQALARHHPLALKRYKISHNPAFKALPSGLQMRLRPNLSHYGLPLNQENDAPGMAEIIIGCGRQAIAPLRIIKRKSPAIFTVYIQDPKIAPEHFDLVIAPRHDGLSGPNVETMIGAPSKVTPQSLKAAAHIMTKPLSAFPGPHAAILIGGPSKIYDMPSAVIEQHIAHAQTLLDAGFSLLISTSRRTPPAALELWKNLAQQNPNHIWFYNGSSAQSDETEVSAPNPYQAFLQNAQIILVTQESTNMLTEACITAKPVFTLEMREKPKYKNKAHKFSTLYQSLAERCHLAPFAYPFKVRAYAPLNETPQMAEKIWQRFLLRSKSQAERQKA